DRAADRRGPGRQQMGEGAAGFERAGDLEKLELQRDGQGAAQGRGDLEKGRAPDVRRDPGVSGADRVATNRGRRRLARGFVAHVRLLSCYIGTTSTSTSSLWPPE